MPILICFVRRKALWQLCEVLGVEVGLTSAMIAIGLKLLIEPWWNAGTMVLYGFVPFLRGTLLVTSGYYGSWEAVTAILLVSLPYLTGASSVSKPLGLQSCPAVLHGTLAKYAAWCFQLWQGTWWFGIGHRHHGSHSQPLTLPTLSNWPSGRFARPTSGPESLAECELVILIVLEVQRSSVILARISLSSGTCQDSW